MRRRGDSRAGKDDPVRVFGILTVTSPEAVVTTLSRWPLRGAGLAAFVRSRADRGGGLGLHEQLQHRLPGRAHQIHTVSGAQRLRQLEQGRLVQGHRMSPSLRVAWSLLAEPHAVTRSRW